jgi:hypothetical protein
MQVLTFKNTKLSFLRNLTIEGNFQQEKILSKIRKLVINEQGEVSSRMFIEELKPLIEYRFETYFRASELDVVKDIIASNSQALADLVISHNDFSINIRNIYFSSAWDVKDKSVEQLLSEAGEDYKILLIKFEGILLDHWSFK